MLKIAVEPDSFNPFVRSPIRNLLLCKAGLIYFLRSCSRYFLKNWCTLGGLFARIAFSVQRLYKSCTDTDDNDMYAVLSDFFCKYKNVFMSYCPACNDHVYEKLAADAGNNNVRKK